MVRDVSTSLDATRKIAILTMAMTLTPALAPALGGLISDAFGWRAVFAALAAVVGARRPRAGHPAGDQPPAGGAAGDRGDRGGVWAPAAGATYRAYVVAGACAGTSLYAFLAVAPFLLVERLGARRRRWGSTAAGGRRDGRRLGRGGRLAGRVPIRRAARWGNLLCLAGAALLLAVDRTGHLSVATLLAPLALYAVGVGLLGPNAVAGLMNVDPFAAGAASSLYGFLQMALGALFTLAVAAWSDGTATPVAVTLLVAALVAAAALRRAMNGRAIASAIVLRSPARRHVIRFPVDRFAMRSIEHRLSGCERGRSSPPRKPGPSLRTDDPGMGGAGLAPAALAS